jgi:predicted nuclease with TOPRIM domain
LIWQAGALSAEVRLNAVQLEKRVDKLEGKIDRVQEQVEKRVDKLEGKIDRVQEQVTQLNKRMDKLEGAMDRVQEQVTQIDKRFDRLEAKLDQVLKAKWMAAGDAARRVEAAAGRLFDSARAAEVAEESVRPHFLVKRKNWWQLIFVRTIY